MLLLVTYPVAAEESINVIDNRIDLFGVSDVDMGRATLVIYDKTESQKPDKENIVQIEQTKIVNGEYNFSFSFDYDGELSNYCALLNVGGTVSTLLLEEKSYRYDENFVLFRVDDAVKPDDTFNVYGQGLNQSGIRFYASEINDIRDVNYTGDDSRIELIKVNVDDDGTYAQLILPKDTPEGTYNLWAIYSDVMTNVIQINRARPLWISENIINAGNEVLISGRNLSSDEWNYDSQSQVKFKNDYGSEYFAIVNDINPFAIKFTVDETVPTGEYELFVSNDGMIWSPLANGDKITVTSSVSDPYELNVAWSERFNTADIYNVTDYGADGSDTADDTISLQNAINAASINGGVVYFPNGSYYFEQLNFKGMVVIEGESKANTFLIYRPDITKNLNTINTRNAINSSTDVGMQGIVNITLTYDQNLSNDYLPSNLLCMGTANNQQNVDLRTPSYGFMKNVNISYSKDVPAEIVVGRVYIGYKDHFVVDGCNFYGHHANITSSYIGNYLRITNNIVDTNIGGFYIYSQYGVFENNHFTRLANNTADETDYGTQGIYTRGENYIANNTIVNTGCKQGGGEILAAEDMRGGTKMYGDVVEASGTEIIISPVRNSQGAILGSAYGSGMWAWDFSRKCSGDWYIVIVDGKGTGQYRKIISAIETDEKLIIDKEWDIVPDATSKFTVVMALANVTFYNNTAVNARWSMLFYGPTLDCVISDNTLTDTAGIQIQVIHKTSYDDTLNYSTQAENDTLDVRKNMAYFNRICRNTLSGTSWVGLTSEITVITKIENTEVHGLPVLGVTISDNEITGDGKSPEEIFAERSSDFTYGQFFRNGINIAMNVLKRKPENPTVEAVIIENNTLANLYDGITVGGAGYVKDADGSYMATLCGTTTENISVRDNIFDNVVRRYTEYSEGETLTSWTSSPTVIKVSDNSNSDEPISIKYTLENVQNKIVDGLLLVAEYDENNKFIQATKWPVFLQGYDSITNEWFCSTPAQSKYIKLFFWNNLNSIQPISKSVKYYI